MTDALITLIKCLAAVLAGIFAGNGAVYFFNKMPAAWLTDYGEKPSEELLDPYTQRVKSYPWKFVFTMLFSVLYIKLVTEDVQLTAAGACVLWLLLEIAIADRKYRIIPDQLVVLVAVCGIGLIPFHGSWQRCLYGVIIGFGFMALTAILGKITYRRDAVGGGDIKLFSALGLVCGPGGIILVFMMTALLSAGHAVILMARGKLKRTDTIAMAPYIAIASCIYLVFGYGIEETLFAGLINF